MPKIKRETTYPASYTVDPATKKLMAKIAAYHNRSMSGQFRELVRQEAEQLLPFLSAEERVAVQELLRQQVRANQLVADGRAPY